MSGRGCVVGIEGVAGIGCEVAPACAGRRDSLAAAHRAGPRSRLMARAAIKARANTGLFEKLWEREELADRNSGRVAAASGQVYVGSRTPRPPEA